MELQNDRRSKTPLSDQQLEKLLSNTQKTMIEKFRKAGWLFCFIRRISESQIHAFVRINRQSKENILAITAHGTVLDSHETKFRFK